MAMFVELVQNSKPTRRWSKRRLLIVVSSLITGLLLLVISVVGFAHSFGFVVNAADALGDVGEIAPERAAPTGSAVSPGRPVSSLAETSPSRDNGGSTPAPRALPTLELPTQAPGGAAGASGSGGAAMASDPPAQTDGGAESDSAGGAGGSATPAWDDVVQAALALLSRNTSSMCGQNTCNVGQVCCNASCGVCVAPGSTCDKQQCAGAARTPTVVRCGSTQCNDGQVCCNASCGICAAPGTPCSDQACP